jgi:hypothetical protein
LPKTIKSDFVADGEQIGLLAADGKWGQENGNPRRTFFCRQFSRQLLLSYLFWQHRQFVVDRLP